MSIQIKSKLALSLLTICVFSASSNAANYQVRYELPVSVAFSEKPKAPTEPEVPVKPTEPEKPAEPEEPFDLTPWQNITLRTTYVVAGNPTYEKVAGFYKYRTETKSKNSDVVLVIVGNSRENEFEVILNDPTQTRDWTDFKKHAKTLSITFKNNPLTVSCQISSFQHTATSLEPGMGITAACEKLGTSINFHNHTNQTGRLEMTMNIY